MKKSKAAIMQTPTKRQILYITGNFSILESPHQSQIAPVITKPIPEVVANIPTEMRMASLNLTFSVLNKQALRPKKAYCPK